MSKIIQNRRICLFLALALLVNGLMFMNLLENTQDPVFGIASRKLILLMQVCADGVLFCIFGTCVKLIKKSPHTATAVYAFLTPLASLVFLESIVGNLTCLPGIAIALNLLILALFLGMSIAFFQKIKTALLLHNILFLLLGLIQYYVFKFRGKSFTLSDLSCAWTAAQVAGGYSYALDFTVGLTILFALGWLYLVFELPDVKLRKLILPRRIMVLLLCLVCFHFLSDRSFTSQHNIFAVNMWNPDLDNQTKGYLLSLASQIQYLTVDTPEGYSEDKVREIGDKYRKLYNTEYSGKDASIQPVNLIVIMNESWCDFRLVSRDAREEYSMPFIDRLQKNVTKGWLRVPVYGSGTSNTEYEVLTGNSTFLLEGNPPASYHLRTHQDEYGMASTLSAQGYQTIAMHPASALNYNRKRVYTEMGFDQFIAREDWEKQYKEKIRKQISDQACYDYIADLYSRKDSGEKMFTFLVTMQNHGGYAVSDYVPTVTLDYGQEYPEAEQYLSLLHETDHAFESLVTHFEQVDEPTMIVMYGDHWPNLQDNFYDVLFENGLANPTVEENRARFTTPFIIWTNYERPTEADVTMGAYFFGSYILQQAGVQLTDYNRFLLETEKQIPVISPAEIMLPDGSWQPADTLSGQLQDQINEYKILQYNNVFGGSRTVDSVFTLP